MPMICTRAHRPHQNGFCRAVGNAEALVPHRAPTHEDLRSRRREMHVGAGRRSKSSRRKGACDSNKNNGRLNS